MGNSSVSSGATKRSSDDERTSDDLRGEAHVALPPHLSVAVCDDMTRVRVGADQAGDLHVQSGLFLDLPDGRSREGISQLHPAAGQRPQAVVDPPLEQDASRVVRDDCRRGDEQGVWLRRVGVVVELGPGYVLSLLLPALRPLTAGTRIRS